MNDTSRREFPRSTSTAMAAAALTGGATALASDATVDKAMTDSNAKAIAMVQPKPLAFDPAKLKGLSEKLIRSHWENNFDRELLARRPPALSGGLLTAAGTGHV